MGQEICMLCDKIRLRQDLPVGVMQQGICPECAEDEDSMIPELTDEELELIEELQKKEF